MDTKKFAINLLTELIKIESISRSEDNAADFLARYLEAEGYRIGRHLNNIWLMSAGLDASKPTVLLNSHIDTVKPSSSWTENPFGARVEDGKLYGLGSNDAGASLVSLLAAFLELTQKDQPYNLIYLASAEEEVSGKNGVEAVLPLLPTIDFAIVGEPTQMQMAIAEKGLMVLDGLALGKSGHAARNEGINALYLAIDDINNLRHYRFAKSSDLLGEVKVTVAQIEAGKQHNVVPDRCSFVVDVRTNELYSNQEVLELLQKEVSCKLEARSVRLNSSRIAKTHPFVQRGLQKGLEAYGSPTMSDQALMNFTTIKMGPGDSARSHTPNEYILFNEIENGIDLYIEMLDGLEIKKM